MPLSFSDTATGKPFLNSLIVFMTGSAIIDPTDDSQVVFHNDTKKTLIEADSCFNSIILPSFLKPYEEFKESCTISVSSGAMGDFKKNYDYITIILDLLVAVTVFYKHCKNVTLLKFMVNILHFKVYVTV